METLLKNDFTVHYGLPVSTVANISANTSESYFELSDDLTIIHTVIGHGIAKYSNVSKVNITAINFESFINSLPVAFTNGREKCDLLVIDDNKKYFLLNEITDTLPSYVNPFTNTRGNQPGKRQKAISQLLSSLTMILAVPSIQTFVNLRAYKHCCFFNKQAMAPDGIIATTAFNRLDTVVVGGLKMSNPAIEAFGFEFWEYSGNQVYDLA